MNIQEFLNASHVKYEVLEHEPTSDAQHMAHAVHVKGRAVAKTVLLRASHDDEYLTAILPATRKIDFNVADWSLGRGELRLATEAEVSEVCPGCEAGVLLPFGSQYGVTTVVDSSLTKEDDIIFEGSTHHEAIRMKFVDFCRLEEPLIATLTQTAE